MEGLVNRTYELYTIVTRGHFSAIKPFLPDKGFDLGRHEAGKGQAPGNALADLRRADRHERILHGIDREAGNAGPNPFKSRPLNKDEPDLLGKFIYAVPLRQVGQLV